MSLDDELDQPSGALKRRDDDRFRHLMEQASDGIFLVDARGRFVEVNPAGCALLGYSREELLRLAIPDVVPPEDLETDPDRLGAPRTEQTLPSERHLRRKDGTLVPVEISTRMLPDGGCQGIARDISGRRKIAERERQAARLARTEKLQAIGQMASGVAHDLSHSLALIAGYTDLAREILQRLGLDVPQLAEALEIAARAATDAGESATRLLAFSRSQPTGEAELVDVGVLLRDVARLTAPRWRNAAMTEGRPITLRVDVEGRDLAVRGWGSSLREAITNLVFNAVDALPEGGEIRFAARRAGDGVRVEIADSGIGMPEDVREQAFEPFFTTKGEGGTGLGLYTVRQVIARHGGEIDIESAPGLGTTFRIKLPAAAPADVAVQPDCEASMERDGRRRVLVVDDDPRLGQMVRAMLARHHVVTAASGEEALERLAAEPFDLIISDLGMGAGMDGWGLAERVRRDWPGLRFVLATGWGATISEEEARQRGVDAVMAKPFSVRQLWELIESVPVGAATPGRPSPLPPSRG